ncbi:MAG TPA: amidoligase [Anaerolineales bacterium]|nr:amidoligase [Anaerolineales bacterium]
MDLREISFGVEIETVKRRRERVARAIQSVVGGNVRHVGSPACFDPWEVTDTQGRVWKVVADGSLINVPGHLRAEVVSPVLAYEDIPTLQEVIRAVRRCGAKVDEKCGIHIHVDARPFDGRTLANLAKIIYKQEALILTALGVNENRLRNYSKPVSDELIRKIERSRPRTKDQLNRIWYGYHNRRPQHFDSTRYYGVNLHNVWYRGTVEFRWFEGTLHAGKVKAYIQLVLAIAAKALNGRAASSRKRSLDPQSARYDFRVFLLHLGLIGDEFKTARKHLLAALPGDSAFKRGRPKPKPKDEPSAPKDGTHEEAGPHNSAGQPNWTCRRHARRARAMEGERQTRSPAFSGDGAAPHEGGEA